MKTTHTITTIDQLIAIIPEMAIASESARIALTRLMPFQVETFDDLSAVPASNFPAFTITVGKKSITTGNVQLQSFQMNRSQYDQISENSRTITIDDWDGAPVVDGFDYDPRKGIDYQYRKPVSSNAILKAFGSHVRKSAPNQCGRCGGTGRRPEFAHVDNGVCFACSGTGKKQQVTA